MLGLGHVDPVTGPSSMSSLADEALCGDVLSATAMLEAFVLGAIGQVSLVLAGLAAYVVKVPTWVVGSLAAYGAGSLLGAVAFDLIPEASLLPGLESALWLLIGAGVFVAADTLVDRMFGGDDATHEGAGPMGIVVGSVVDGIPESVIFGITLASGQPISVAFLAAVFVSNIPQAFAPSADLAASGWSRLKLSGMWGVVVLACGLAALVGFAVAEATGISGDRVAAFAAGGLLAMLTDSLIPYAFQRAKVQAGIWVVVGFAVALAQS
jgi:ZIP family zinc transporter